MLLFSIISNSYIVQFVHIDVICSFYLLHITLFIVAIYCNLFSHSIVDGHLDCFQFGTVLHTTVNILHIYIYAITSIPVSVWYIPGVVTCITKLNK